MGILKPHDRYILSDDEIIIEALKIDQQSFEQRKRDHIALALKSANEAVGLSGLDFVTLEHEAIPDIEFNDVSIHSYRFGKRVPSPFIVSSMTAGHPDSINFNLRLMAACQETGWTMGVGSQRRELSDLNAAEEWAELRQQAPNVILLGNLGITQLINANLDDVERLVDALEATGMIIHCNPLQECIQPEGTPHFKGAFNALAELSEHLSVPVIVKETGCGFSQSTLQRLMSTNIAAVDISGLGGTHWGRIEGERAKKNSIQQHAAETFKNWGISTVDSLQHAVGLTPNYEVWGSGGVRNGLDAAKLLYLGASSIGFAKPILQAAQHSTEAVIDFMKRVEYELKVALFCTGNATIETFQMS